MLHFKTIKCENCAAVQILMDTIFWIWMTSNTQWCAGVYWQPSVNQQSTYAMQTAVKLSWTTSFKQGLAGALISVLFCFFAWVKGEVFLRMKTTVAWWTVERIRQPASRECKKMRYKISVKPLDRVIKMPGEVNNKLG